MHSLFWPLVLHLSPNPIKMNISIMIKGRFGTMLSNVNRGLFLGKTRFLYLLNWKHFRHIFLNCLLLYRNIYFFSCKSSVVCVQTVTKLLIG